MLKLQKNHTKALEKKKEVEAKLEEQYALLKQARQELEEIVDKQSSEYAQAIGRVNHVGTKGRRIGRLKKCVYHLSSK